MAKSIDTHELNPQLHVELSEDRQVTLIDTSNDPYLPDFTIMDADTAIRLLDYLLLHQERIRAHATPARTSTIENIATSVDDKDIDAWLASQGENYTDEEIRHARELQEHGITDITDLVRQKLEEKE